MLFFLFLKLNIFEREKIKIRECKNRSIKFQRSSDHYFKGMNAYYSKEIGNIQQKRRKLGTYLDEMENMELSSQFTHTRIETNLVNFTIATSLNMENNDPCGIGKKIIWAAHAKVK